VTSDPLTDRCSNVDPSVGLASIPDPASSRVPVPAVNAVALLQLAFQYIKLNLHLQQDNTEDHTTVPSVVVVARGRILSNVENPMVSTHCVMLDPTSRRGGILPRDKGP
jgi:hypothetical protein